MIKIEKTKEAQAANNVNKTKNEPFKDSSPNYMGE